MIRSLAVLLVFFGVWLPAFAQTEPTVLTAEKTEYEQLVDGIRVSQDDISSEYIYSEEIRNFDAVLDLRASPSLRVTERIGYDFMETMRHGIYRNVFADGPEGATEPLLFSGASATGPDGEVLTTQIQGLTETRKGPSILSAILGESAFLFDMDPAMLSIRIGDPDIEIDGFHTYVIRYTVENAISYYDEFDEIYWDVTGSEWSYPIRSATATVILPTIIEESDLRIASYCGEIGSTASCGDATVVTNHESGRTEVHFVLQGELQPHENMTVAVGFPKGIVAVPPPPPQLPEWVAYFKYWPLFVIAILPLYLFRNRFSYITRRRAYYSHNPVVPEYDFDELTPLEALAIHKGVVESSKIGAEIIWLAAHGYLTITEVEKGQYRFESTGKDTSELKSFDKSLYDGISGHTNTSLKYVFYITIRHIVAAVEEGLVVAGYQEKMGQRFRNTRAGAFGLCLFLAINPGLFVWVLVGWKVGLAFSGVMLMCGLLSLLLGADPFLSEKGLAVERKLLGLREYIKTAEEARLAYHHAPERKPEDFERLLPYAMIFGLERAWARHFESMSLPPPNWYHSSSSTAFSVGAFSSSMSAFSRSAGSSLSASPGGSGSGGSGGGGSSGGGGGGGGGGSW